MLFGHHGCCLSQEIPYGPPMYPLMAPHVALMAPHVALAWLFPAFIMSQ